MSGYQKSRREYRKRVYERQLLMHAAVILVILFVVIKIELGGV